MALERGEWSAACSGCTLPPRKDTVPIVQEAGWASGPVWMGKKSHPTRIWSPDRPARSQSLYRLSYSAPRRHQASLLIRRSVGHFSNIMPTEDATLQNSFLFMMCQRVCGMWLFHMNETALLLYLALMAKTSQLLCTLCQWFSWNCLKCSINFIQFFLSMYFLHDLLLSKT